MFSSAPAAARPVVFAGIGALGTRFAAASPGKGRLYALHWGGRPASIVNRQLISSSGEAGEKTEAVDISLPGIVLADLAALAPGWLLITAKSSAAMALLDELLRHHDSETTQLRGWTVVLLQNGMTCHYRARELVTTLTAASRPILLAATTTEAARRSSDSPSTILHSASGLTTTGALLDSSEARSQASKFAALLRNAGMKSVHVDDIEPALWHKLAVNCVINPLTALAGCSNGELPSISGFTEAARAICGEVRAAWLLELGPAPTIDELMASVIAICAATAVNRSSMLQDVSAGRPTEIDAINGFIVSCCRRHGLPCGANESLLARIAAVTAPRTDIYSAQDH